jgi:hypothetical protein
MFKKIWSEKKAEGTKESQNIRALLTVAKTKQQVKEPRYGDIGIKFN